MSPVLLQHVKTLLFHVVILAYFLYLNKCSYCTYCKITGTISLKKYEQKCCHHPSVLFHLYWNPRMNINFYSFHKLIEMLVFN